MKQAKYPKGYILATILFIVITSIFLLLCNVVYMNGRQIYRHGFTEVNAAYTIRASLSGISNHFQKVRMVAGQQYDTEQERGQKIAEQTAEIKPKVMAELDNLQEAMEALKNISDLSETDTININELENTVEYISELSLNMLQIDNEAAPESSSNDLTPEERRAQADAKRLASEENSKIMADAQKNVIFALDKALDEWRQETDVEIASSRKFHIISNAMMLLIIAFVSILIIIIGFSIKRKETEVFQQREEAQYQESRAEKANAKTTEIAYKNLIMDCGNRYSLTEFVDSQLKEARAFYIARFELVNFNQILSQNGYDQIDRYMTEAANTIKSIFKDNGILFTTAGEDFIFVFHEGIEREEAQKKADHIRKVIGEVLVASLNIESAVTGAVAYTGKFQDRNADAILTALRSAGIQSANSDQLIFV